jgi:putative hemolysin
LNHSFELFLFLTILCIVFQGYFAMMEMAIVSYNKVRLQYLISKGDRKAKWLKHLLKKPTYLFGTTLIGVNFFLQLGSECARSFYETLGLDPDYAVFSQIILVVLFAELTPLFAARSFPENVVRLGITPIYFLSKIFTPFVYFLDGVCRFIDWVLGSKAPSQNYLTREELQKAIEGKEIKDEASDKEHLDSIVKAIFVIKGKTPPELMKKIHEVPILSSDALVKDAYALLERTYVPYLPIYYKKPENIVGILYARDLLKLNPEDPIQPFSRSPWFITEKNSLFQILKQFRWNNQHIAVVLDENGNGVGILALESLIEEIFEVDMQLSPYQSGHIILNRKFSADTKISKVNQELQIELPFKEGDTLEDLMTHILEHEPSKLETARIKNFELHMESSALFEEKIITIRSL